MKTDLPAMERLKLRIVGLDCVSCFRVINRALEGVKGVSKVGVSFMMDLVFIEYNESREQRGNYQHCQENRI